MWDDPIWFDSKNHPELFDYRKRIEEAGKKESDGLNPKLMNVQMRYKNGPLVAEALRSGVQLNPLQHFMNVDDVAILRLTGSPDKMDMNGILYRTLQQIGKGYDFNFDVETLDKIVCSELAYQTYDSINWETEETVGRFTISPDHIARQAFNGALKLITFYHDGARVPPQKQLKLMHRLMNDE